MHAVAIIPAAGRGVRMQSQRPKVFTSLLGKPLIVWSLEPFLELNIFSEILIACPPDSIDSIERIISKEGHKGKSVRLVGGGDTRQESVARCIQEISGECDMVAVHDAARPLLTSQLLMDVLNRANETDAAIAAVPCKDTVKRCDEDGIVSETLDRSKLWLVQTPQCFRRKLLVSAHEKAQKDKYTATDDAALVERINARVHVVMGTYENIKITTPEDIQIGEDILRRRMLL
jgi:2-C-methyl-D-erythritol 4-phosphate cytidylyltransferase